jgi:hypothetical protein
MHAHQTILTKCKNCQIKTHSSCRCCSHIALSSAHLFIMSVKLYSELNVPEKKKNPNRFHTLTSEHKQNAMNKRRSKRKAITDTSQHVHRKQKVYPLQPPPFTIPISNNDTYHRTMLSDRADSPVKARIVPGIQTNTIEYYVRYTYFIINF